MVMIRVTVWNENVHEKEIPEVTKLYPQGIHGELAAYLRTLAISRYAPRRWMIPTAA